MRGEELAGRSPSHSLRTHFPFHVRYQPVGCLHRQLSVSSLQWADAVRVGQRERGNAMKRKGPSQSDHMRAEYTFDYTKAVRGKLYRRLIKEGANIAVLEPDVANVFRDSASVNAALRSLLEVSEATRRLTVRSKRGPKKRVAA
jgi:hypothetical protein